MTYQQIAKQIEGKMIGTKYKPGGAYARALTIARTEGHRIQCQSTFDALYKAKDKGADVVKQWDSTLDGLTRPSHREVDGEIRELDEAFSNGLQFPGDPSGPAAEVCNCRCALLQRARWALKETVDPDTGVVEWEDGHFTKWDSDEAKIVDFSGIKDYNTFKQKYIQTAKTIPVKNYGCELATKFGNAYYDEVQRLVSSSGNPTAQAVWNKYESQIQVTDAHYTGRAHCSGNAISVNGPNDAKGAKWFAPYQTTFHESGHAIDYMARKAPNIPNPSTSWGSRHFSSAYEDSKFPKTIKKEVSDWVDAVDKDLKAQFKAHKDDYDWLHDHGFISDWSYDFYKQHGMWISGPPKYSKSYAYSKIQTEISSLPPRAKADLSDILEGATGAKIQCGCGHGKSYWKNKNFAGEEDGLATEAFAEMIDSTFTCPESVEAIRKYLPKSYSVFEEMLDFLSKV